MGEAPLWAAGRTDNRVEHGMASVLGEVREDRRSFCGGGETMTYRYCESWNQRIAEAVCENRLAKGKCKKTKAGCREVRTANISDEERLRRSTAMKKIRKQKEEVEK